MLSKAMTFTTQKITRDSGWHHYYEQTDSSKCTFRVMKLSRTAYQLQDFV